MQRQIHDLVVGRRRAVLLAHGVEVHADDPGGYRGRRPSPENDPKEPGFLGWEGNRALGAVPVRILATTRKSRPSSLASSDLSGLDIPSTAAGDPIELKHRHREGADGLGLIEFVLDPGALAGSGNQELGRIPRVPFAKEGGVKSLALAVIFG